MSMTMVEDRSLSLAQEELVPLHFNSPLGVAINEDIIYVA